MGGNPQITPIPIDYIRYEPGVKTTVAYTNKGTVSAYEDLPSTSNLVEGDMYRVGDTDDYYVWDGRYWNLVTLPESGGGADIEIVEWHQCPEAVRQYMANVTYDPADYTTTSVTSYAPSPAVTSNTKPIGKTVDGVTYYNGVPGVAVSYVGLSSAATVTPLDQVRWINSSTNNFRDIGGWSCDGGTVKYGLIYRAADLNASDEDLVLRELGIKTEIDFTNDNLPAYGNAMRYTTYPSSPMYSISNKAAWRVYLRAIIDSVLYGDPAIIHCHMGADRTGTVACILEGLLGVSQSDLDKDYELTSFYATRARNGNYQGGTTDWAHFIGQINALSGSTIRDKIVNFVLSLGFTADEINAYRAAMIDGTPETLTPSIPSATITNTLTHATSSNAATSINYYQTYEADITPSSGYVIDSVSITMGGTDISSGSYVEEIYPNNVVRVSVPNVSGNISITVTASETVLPNLFDSTDPDVSLRGRFNSSGAAVAYADGQLVTGYIPASVGDVFVVETDKSLQTNTYTGMVECLDASKVYITSTIPQGASAVWSFDSENTTGVCTIPSIWSGHDYSATAYVRFCVAYTDIANIKITKPNEAPTLE